MTLKERFHKDFKQDDTFIRTKRYAGQAVRATPSVAFKYITEKVPIIFWLPKYNPRWLFNDVIAGVTIGIMLIPQGLSYAKIATIDGQFGLLSGWLPAAIYVAMGTSKDLSTGPTSLTALLTADAIKVLGPEGFSGPAVAAAMAFMVGVYCLIMGLLKIGFLLNFVSLPVLTGFVSAVAIVILLGQVDSLLGLENVRDGTANIIHDVITGLGQTAGLTAAVGFGSIVLLTLLQKAGQRWGKKSKIIWMLSISRAAVVLILFTGISYAVNNGREEPLWEIAETKSSGLIPPKAPEFTLIQKAAPLAFAPFLAASIEHLAIGKGFGRKNNYFIDESQELVYLGVTNFFNSFFGAQIVGGAMSRTAVNSESGVRSPLGGLFTAGVILLSIYKLSGALFWIPKATLAAIIITAVYHMIDIKSWWGYWKTSLADFIACQTSFWVTLFVSTEVGIAASVGFSIMYTLLRAMFSSPKRILTTREYPTENLDVSIPDDTKIFRFQEAVLFHNAYRLKNKVLMGVQTYNSGDAATQQKQHENRNWSVSGERRIREMRAKAKIINEPVPIRYVILDMAAVTYIDQTGITALQDLKTELRKYGGDRVQIRFVRMDEPLRQKFERGKWDLVDMETMRYGLGKNADVVYGSMTDAIYDGRREGSFMEEDLPMKPEASYSEV